MTPLTIFFHCCLFMLALLPPIFLLNVWLYFRVLRPICRLSALAAGIAEGHFSALEQPIGGIPEIESLRRNLLGMVGHIRRDQQQRKAYTEAITEAQETERRRLAHELHDDTVQALIAIGQGIELATQWVCSQPEQAAAMLKLARQQVTETVNSLRHLICNLRPPALEDLGLVPALHTWAEQVNGLQLHVDIKGTPRRLNNMQELTLFRCAQEAISNAQQHGDAEEVQLTVAYQLSGVSLSIQDDGEGSSVPEKISSLAGHGHYGLMGIQERVQQLQGSFTISSHRHQGTRLDIVLPSQESRQPDNLVRDPVCAALLAPHEAYGSCEHDGERYYFCCPVCQGAFQNAPESYRLLKQAVA